MGPKSFRRRKKPELTKRELEMKIQILPLMDPFKLKAHLLRVAGRKSGRQRLSDYFQGQIREAMAKQMQGIGYSREQAIAVMRADPELRIRVEAIAKEAEREVREKT